MTTRSKSGIIKVKNSYVGIAEAKIVDSTLIRKLESIEAALKVPHWKEAMIKEFEAITKNYTWSLVPLNEKSEID